MVHVAVNKSDFEKKINILEYASGEGGGGHQKAYAVYASTNVDNCERPLRLRCNEPTRLTMTHHIMLNVEAAIWKKLR